MQNTGVLTRKWIKVHNHTPHHSHFFSNNTCALNPIRTNSTCPPPFLSPLSQTFWTLAETRRCSIRTATALNLGVTVKAVLCYDVTDYCMRINPATSAAFTRHNGFLPVTSLSALSPFTQWLQIPDLFIIHIRTVDTAVLYDAHG